MTAPKIGDPSVELIAYAARNIPVDVDISGASPQF
jgi:hypothetical protein